MPDGTAPSIQDRLAAVLERNALSDRAHEQVQKVHDLLTKPKRITLMGPPGAGKAGVMALLAGRNVLGDTLDMGTVKLSYGDTQTTTVTVRDGNTRTFDGLPDPDIIGMMTPLMTEITAPLPALRKITLTKLAEADDEAGQVRAMLWAAKQSDLAIWCTRKFSKMEQHLWSQVPAALRDNSIALMTNCDAFDGDRKKALAALQPKAENDFAFVMAMRLRDAMKASLRSKVDRDGMRQSGGMQLISTILKEIEKADIRTRDEAEDLLANLAGTATDAAVLERDLIAKVTDAAAADQTQPPLEGPDIQLPEPSAEVDAAPQTLADMVAKAPKIPDATAFTEAAKMIDPSAVAATEPPAAPAKPAAKRTYLEPDIFPDFELAQTPEPAAAPAAAAAPAPAKAEPLPAEALTACQGAVIRLQAIGTDYATVGDDARDLLDASAKALTALDEDLMDVGRIDHPRFKRLRRMTEDASDLVQLLRLEGDTEASVEATTLLLQVKRSFQAAVAA